LTALVTSYIQHFPYLGPLLVLMAQDARSSVR
jgi:hypothetical protein